MSLYLRLLVKSLYVYVYLRVYASMKQCLCICFVSDDAFFVDFCVCAFARLYLCFCYCYFSVFTQWTSLHWCLFVIYFIICLFECFSYDSFFFTLSVVIYIRAKVAHVINYLHLNTHVPECVHACICYLDGCMHDWIYSIRAYRSDVCRQKARIHVWYRLVSLSHVCKNLHLNCVLSS